MKKLITLAACMALLVTLIFPLTSFGKVSTVDLGIQPIRPDGKNIYPIKAVAPDGKKFQTVDSIMNILTPADIKKVKNGNFTAAICMHYTGADWPQLQIKGIKDTLQKFNVKVLTVTDAKLKPDQQMSDVESVIALKPNVIFIQPIDIKGLGSIFKKAAAMGIKTVGLDNAPAGITYPKELIGVCQADNYSIAEAAANIIAERIGKKGNVALLDFKFAQFHTDMRSRAARETFAKYPNIKIVASQKIGGEEDAGKAAESILVAHPELDAIWAVWDGPGMAAAAAAKNLGRNIVVASPDLGKDAAYSIASNGLYIGSGAQHPYDQGVVEGVMAVAALAGKKVPQYIAVPGEKVTRDNLKEAWEHVFHEPMTKEIMDALSK